ncbi:hypothetical protein DFA_11817 [Cavenderia fasciculata]|uniref:Uncharacterized protein n=1 Tax=Cavenderia fasciculata TaxID=261658 RepID=F4QEA7_CACFS|nr:uncharacterized protein DFA_11817 [Cavenderia fasciculata]EGG14054.1 hypothetical protein DFA_11817 [Cavenderia fasciculata]|eukprot:XP_004350762.1 hypothetical protein DFA_11817 [Cavenderia fasciculata]
MFSNYFLLTATGAAAMVGALSYYWKKSLKESQCGIDYPSVHYNSWKRLHNGFSMDQFLEMVKPLDDPSSYQMVLEKAMDLKKNKNSHVDSLILMSRINSTIKKLDLENNDLSDEIQLFIDCNKCYAVLQREAKQYYDLIDAFINEDGYIKDPVLEHTTEYSYRYEGRQLKSRKFIKIIDRPLINCLMRTQEIDIFNTWKWYQHGKTVTPSDGTYLCSIISILSKFIILNRAAYCWRLSFPLPDGSYIVSYNGANNRPSDYDLPPLPTGFAYPDIFYHGWRFIPLSKNKTMVISVMESDPKIWFLPFEYFIRMGKSFGCRELKLLDEFSATIAGTSYDKLKDREWYQNIKKDLSLLFKD